MSNEKELHGKDEKENIDIEEYAKEGKDVPPGHSYRIRIDKTQYEVHVSAMTGRELLTLAGKAPVEQYRIYQKMKGGQSVEIPYDSSADFTKPGVERFITLALEQTEG